MKCSPYTMNKDRYEEERKRHKEKDCDVAKYLNLTRQRFSNLKNGQPMQESYLRQLGEKWGINWKWLCGLSDNRDTWASFEHEAWDVSWEMIGKDYLDAVESFLCCLGYSCDFSDAPSQIKLTNFSKMYPKEKPICLTHNEFFTFVSNLLSITMESAACLLRVMQYKDDQGINYNFTPPIFTKKEKELITKKSAHSVME